MHRYKSRKSNKNEQIHPSIRRSVRERTVKFLETTVQDNISPKGKLHRLKSTGQIDNNDLAFNVQTENLIENDSINSNEINQNNIKRGPRKFTSSFKRKSTIKNNNISIKEDNSKLLIEKISPLKLGKMKDVNQKIVSDAKQRRLHRKNTKTNNIVNDDDDNNNNNEAKNEDKINENNNIDLRRDKRFKRLKTKDYRKKKNIKKSMKIMIQKKKKKLMKLKAQIATNYK